MVKKLQEINGIVLELSYGFNYRHIFLDDKVIVFYWNYRNVQFI